MGQQTHVVLIVFLVVQWFVCWRLALRLLTRGGAPSGPPPTADRISIIIPARNEELNLPGLLESLASQKTAALEVIVVDDHSDDATAAVAEAHQATVICLEPPPPGWRGKTWACQNGAEAARGTYLLFLDADTRLVPDDGLSRLLHRYPGGAWSLVPWHAIGSRAESFSAFFNLLMALGTIPNGLAGPCLLIPRKDYLASGGHAAVKDRILENVHLGGVLRRQAVQIRSSTGRGLISFRMYPGGFSELIAGWTKGFAGGAATTPAGTLTLIILWISSLFVAAGAVMLSPWFVLIYALYSVQLGWMLRRVGAFPIWTAIFYPVPLIFYLVVFIRSLGPAGKQATWKGRGVVGDVG